MLVGEDKNKIKNIIQPNMAEFERLYEPYLGSFVERIADGRMRKVSIYAVQPVTLNYVLLSAYGFY